MYQPATFSLSDLCNKATTPLQSTGGGDTITCGGVLPVCESPGSAIVESLSEVPPGSPGSVFLPPPTQCNNGTPASVSTLPIIPLTPAAAALGEQCGSRMDHAPPMVGSSVRESSGAVTNVCPIIQLGNVNVNNCARNYPGYSTVVPAVGTPALIQPMQPHSGIGFAPLGAHQTLAWQQQASGRQRQQRGQLTQEDFDQPCRHFLAGKCTRFRCRFRHSLQ